MAEIKSGLSQRKTSNGSGKSKASSPPSLILSPSSENDVEEIDEARATLGGSASDQSPDKFVKHASLDVASRAPADFSSPGLLNDSLERFAEYRNRRPSKKSAESKASSSRRAIIGGFTAFMKKEPRNIVPSTTFDNFIEQEAAREKNR